MGAVYVVWIPAPLVFTIVLLATTKFVHVAVYLKKERSLKTLPELKIPASIEISNDLATTLKDRETNPSRLPLQGCDRRVGNEDVREPHFGRDEKPRQRPNHNNEHNDGKLF
jgi:hypothetical protein